MDWKTITGLLIDAGLTQKQVAAHCDCSQATISEIARGLSEDPRASIAFSLLALARTHGIDVPFIEAKPLAAT